MIVLRRLLTTAAISMAGSLLSLSALAQTNLNEQFLEAARQGSWTNAIEIIDQIVEQNPSRQSDLAPFREKFSRRLEIDVAIENSQWRQSTVLLTSFVEDYPNDRAALTPILNQVSALADIEDSIRSQDWRLALTQVDDLIEAQDPAPAEFRTLRTNILRSMPQVNTQVTLDNWVLVATSTADITSSATEEPRTAGSTLRLVNLTIQNNGSSSRALDAQNFTIIDSEGATYVATSASDFTEIEPLETPVEANRAFRTGIVFELPRTVSELKLQFTRPGFEDYRLINLGL